MDKIVKTVLRIEGMSCAHCVQHVKEALEGVPGVASADVNLKRKSAAVEHGDAVDPARLKKAVEEAGYEAV